MMSRCVKLQYGILDLSDLNQDPYMSLPAIYAITAYLGLRLGFELRGAGGEG